MTGAWLLLLALAWPHTWQAQGCKITLINPEVTSDRRYVLIHLRLEALQPVEAFAWQGLVTLRNRSGEVVPQGPDCKVDQSITTGMFALKKGAKVPVLMYYDSRPSDFPIQLEIDGQPLGQPLQR